MFMDFLHVNEINSKKKKKRKEQQRTKICKVKSLHHGVKKANEGAGVRLPGLRSLGFSGSLG